MQQRTASIANRLLAILAFSFLGLLVAVSVPMALVVYSGFDELEQARARADLERVHETIGARLDAIDRHATDWGSWDKSYEFAQGRDPEFPHTELTTNSFLSIDLDLILYLDLDGKVIWAGAFDAANSRFVETDPFLRDGFPEGHPLLRAGKGLRGVSGVMSTARGPMLVAARPILTTARTGPAAGVLVMGRLLTPARVTAIARQLHMDLLVEPLSAGQVVRDARGMQVEVDGDRLRATDTYADLFGAPLLAIDLLVPRIITDRGKSAITVALAAVVIVGLITLGMLYWLLLRAVVGPIQRLSATIVRLGKGEDGTTELPVERPDELGALARSVQTMHEQMVRQAHYDSLTRLPRRSRFMEQAEAMLQRLARARGQAAFLFVDMDGFKAVNDRFGHAVGDACLVQAAARLRSHVRGYDLVARLGGDEFVLALEGIPGPDEAASVARKLLEALAQPYGSQGEVQMSASIGIGLYPDHGAELESLLAAADRAMYEAKQAGKNTYRFFRAGR